MADLGPTTVAEPNSRPRPNGVVPGDAVDAIVASLWSEHFAAGGARPAATVFDAAPGLLLAARFVDALAARTGVTLPISAVFDCGTASAISCAVRTGAAPPFRPLLLIAPGVPGGGAPLVLLPGLGGSIGPLFGFARRLRHTGPVLVGQFAGLDPAVPAHDTVEGMARFQADAIRAAFGPGPCHLLGYCFGGLVALETARLLARTGAGTAFLGMIEPSLAERAWPWPVRARFVARRVRDHAATLRRVRPGARLAYARHHASAFRCRLARLLGRDGGGWSPYRLVDLPQALARLQEANLAAYDAYLPQPYDGRVTIFQSSGGDPLTCRPGEIWPRLIRDLDIVPVAGAHDTMLLVRNAAVLAERVTAALTAAGGAPNPERDRARG